VTLNDLERYNSSILLYFAEFDSVAGLLRHSTVVEDRPILSAEYCFTFGHNSPTLQRGLSAIAELLINERLEYGINSNQYRIQCISFFRSCLSACQTI